MRRNLGWTAILAVWTIFLILNGGLAGEQIPDNPRVNNAHNSREARRIITIPVLDKRIADVSRPRYAKEIFEAKHRSSTRTRATTPKSRDTRIRDFNGLEKRVAMTGVPPGCSGNRDNGDTRVSAAEKLERVATGNTGWLKKIVILEGSASGKTRYRRSASNRRVSSPAFRALRSALRRRKHKEETTCVFSKDCKEVTAITRDAPTYDEWRQGRIFRGGNGAAAFSHGKFPRRLKRARDSSGNSVVSELQTTANTGSRCIGEIRESNNENRIDSHGGGLQVTRNSSDESSHRVNSDSRTTRTTFPSHSSSKRNAGSATNAVTDGTIARSASHGNFAASTASWTTLIFNSGLARGENPFSRYHFAREYSGSYKAVAETPATVTRENRREGERSKTGFRVNTSARGGRKWNEDIGDPFAFRAPSSPDGYLSRNRIDFTDRSPPPLLSLRKKAALRTALDTAALRREQLSSVYKAGAITETSDEANYVTAYKGTNSVGGGVDEFKTAKLSASSPRISVTQQWHPVHVQHVKPADTACKRATQVYGAARTDSWNADSSGIVNFGSSSGQEARNRPRLSRPLSSRVVAEVAADGASSVASKSTSLDAPTTADHPTETRKINERALPSSTDESDGGKNAEVAWKDPDENGDKARKRPVIRSQSDGAPGSMYRRYKRQEDRPSTWESLTLAELEVRGILDTVTTTTTRPPLAFAAGPSIPATRVSNTGEESTAITWGTPTPPEHRGFQTQRALILDTDYERYAGTLAPDSSEITPRTSDQSSAATKTDNSAIRKEVSAEASASASGGKVSSIEPISSPGGRAVLANGSTVPVIDPFPHRSNEPTRDILDNVTAENVDDSSAGSALVGQWPVKHSAVVEGDLVLGGLMMVHEREDTITCGPVMPQGGVQALEAMLYTLDILNDREIVPGVKIGAHILDDCDKDTYGLEMAVDFIKGSISNIDGAEYHCNKTAVRKIISGVVGAASSVTSIQVANLLRLFRIPQVSFFSTSPELSNKQRFEYFTRTIPSDHYQVKAMVDIVLKMGWSYVSIIYEESNYGIKAFEELEELLGKHDICIAIKEKLVKDSGVAEEIAYDNIVSKLLTKPRARGCIIFGSDQEVAGVMRAVRRCNATGAFSWIGSDGWSARGLVSNGNEPEVEGTLSVQPQANPVNGFQEYFLNLTVENNRRNPWFVEFWEDHFKCRYPNASRTPYNKKYTKTCTTEERLTKQNTAFEDQLQFVSDAVMAFAYAFRDMHDDLCHGIPGLCDAMKPTNGTKLLQYLRKVNFRGLSGDKFRFDKNGDGPARYNIIHFKQIEPGRYKWVRVGKYLEGELRLNMSEIQFKLGHPQPPESVCSLPCEVGQAKKYVEGERCCWHCFNCTQYQIRHPKDETQCIQCRQGTVPDETHSTCRDIPEEFLRPESGWAIGAMCFSAFGIFVTLFVCGVFLRHNDTPVVRASGRELSYVLLVGILLCYLVTFTLVLRPTNAVCGIQRVAAGLCFTVVYAALLTKTNRIARIFNDGRQSAKRPSFISPRSQLIICFGLVSVQILINVVWILIDPARAMHHYPTMEDNLLVCNSYIDASYMIAFAYPIILIAVCTVYAVLTRKIPEAFNESKHIGFAMYTTCVIWLAFVPLYFGTGNNVALRITSMSVTISLSASVMVVCLFSPKLYIILIRPERNVRPNIKAGRPNLTKSSAITATNPSSMMGPVAATTVLTAATCDQNKAIKRHIASTMDCSTQSEYYEMEVKEQKNGKPLATCASRSTQTINNEKESTTSTSTTATTTAIAAGNKESSDVIASAGNNKETKNSTTTTKRLNSNARIGNGPLSQSEVSL